MATIYRDKKTGIYFLNIRIDGKRRRVSLETKDRVVARHRAKIRERELGIQYTGPISIADFTKQYLDWSQSVKALNTTRGERVILGRLGRDIAVRRLDQIDVRLADEFIARIAQEASPARVNAYIRTLRSIFATALKWGYVPDNPFAAVRKLKAEVSPPRILSSKELRAILAATERHAPEYLDLWNFYLYTGFRRNEALGLTWEDVDFERGFVTARRTKGKRYRIVPMIGPVRDILERRRGSLKPFEFRERVVSDTFIDMARKVGSPAKLHDLRRAFASYCTEIGVPGAWVQRWLGHVSWNTTDEYYLGINEEMYARLKQLESVISKN